MANGFGFGNQPFGNHPFGHSDFGRNTYLRSFPQEYIEDDSGNVNQVLKRYLEIGKHRANLIKKDIDRLDDQMDFNKVRSDLLQYLGSTFAVELDDYEPDEFRRSLVGNAILFYQRKGTEEAFRIRGKISGYDVEIFNIYKIEPDNLYKYILDYELASGDGTPTQQLIEVLPSYPVNPGTLVLSVDGSPVGTDDGAGGWTATAGYALAGTIDYQTGAYDITFTPGVPTGLSITVDYETVVFDEAVATSDGTQTDYIHQLGYYPYFPNSLKLYSDGVLIGEDDGNEGIVPSVASPYPVSGEFERSTGRISFSFTGAVPPNGEEITINYEKTLVGEVLTRYPDDIYEIPSGSWNWYTTLIPGSIPGAPPEGCLYCQTSFVKIRLITVKNLATVTPSSTENFFDRLVRKIREIVPIHVRDLIYELVLVIAIDENQYLDAEISSSEELTWTPVSMFPRFDVLPADVVTCDSRGYVTGTVVQI